MVVARSNKHVGMFFDLFYKTQGSVPATTTHNYEATRMADKVKEFCLGNGAHLVGFAPVSRFDGAPRGHHPKDFMPDCKTVISIASRILDRGLDHASMMPEASEFIPQEHLRSVMQDYIWEIESHGPTSDLLSALALRVAMIVQDEGYGSLYFRSSNEDRYGSRALGGRLLENTSLFSHKHAAVRAGLGEFGLSNLVITPEFGPRVRFASVITNAEIEPTPLLENKVCLGESCGLCLRRCGHLGVITVLPVEKPDSVWLNTVSDVNKNLCLDVSDKNYCKGQCVRSCPIGAS